MSKTLEQAVQDVCRQNGNDRARMMDIVRDVQTQFGCVSNEAIDLIARCVSTHRVEVESVVSFYSFLSKQPKGKVVIRLCDDIIDKMKGADAVGQALADELGIGFGETTADGTMTLEHTPCIGMCDQAPAAMVNDVIVTEMTEASARQMVKDLKQHMDPAKLVRTPGDGNNADPRIHAMVKSNLRNDGAIVMGPINPGEAIRKALAMSPAEVIRDVKTARLRGRGGAGFPTGMKWEYTRAADGDKRYVLCNADEGEPGTFKDRVILTEKPHRVFVGMTIAGYAIGADEGVLYLRGEYAYLRPFLEAVLQKRRDQNLLGNNICGKDFNFDIRIQMGAGAYICGEETALISSCEGLRGDPKNRPPFPAQKGYLGCPTVVNNVETLCCVAKILEQGPATFCEFGSKGSTGTKVLSISGDCSEPGVYEVPFGIKLSEILAMVKADRPAAVQMGGPSGQLIGPADFGRTICYDDLATGGSIMVFNEDRDVLQIAAAFMEFFIEESCGYCTPCRVGNTLLKKRLDRIMAGKGEVGDLEYLEQLGKTIKSTSRCGLGQTSANPVTTSLANFRDRYEKLITGNGDGMIASFDISAAVSDAEAIAERKSVH